MFFIAEFDGNDHFNAKIIAIKLLDGVLPGSLYV